MISVGDDKSTYAPWLASPEAPTQKPLPAAPCQPIPTLPSHVPCGLSATPSYSIPCHGCVWPCFPSLGLILPCFCCFPSSAGGVRNCDGPIRNSSGVGTWLAPAAVGGAVPLLTRVARCGLCCSPGKRIGREDKSGMSAWRKETIAYSTPASSWQEMAMQSITCSGSQGCWNGGGRR